MVKDRKALMELIRYEVHGRLVGNVASELIHNSLRDERTDLQLLRDCNPLTRPQGPWHWWSVAANAAEYAIRKGIKPTELYNYVELCMFGKGQGYSSEHMFLGNFLRIGRDFGECPILLCRLYAYKHIDFLRESEKTGKIHGPEGVLERCGDVVLYCGLGYSLEQLGE